MKPSYKLYILLLLIIANGTAKAQQVNTVGGVEKIHIHSDKDVYLPGETIWFKAYLLTGYLPDSIHTNLSVDFLDQNGMLIRHSVLPVSDASAVGIFAIPDTVKAQNYFIRAYTGQGNDTAADAFYYKSIAVVTKSGITPTAAETLQTSLHFFPEGGNFVNNVNNRVAFKASYSNGFPFPVKGVLKTEEGIAVDTVIEMHDGMGLLNITPKPGEHYYVEWTDHTGERRQTHLPEPVSNNITLHTEQVNRYLYYVVQCPDANTVLEKINITAWLHDKKIYTATLDMANAPVVSGRIALSGLPSGIIRLAASDSTNTPLAERVYFIDNGYRLNASIAVAEKNTGKRGKNTVAIDIPDSVATNLSVSVYEAGLHQETKADLYSDLLMGDDIKGYVHNPAWYFSDTGMERRKALDLVMQTNGWRHYRTRQIADESAYITLKGLITDQKKNPQPNKSLTLLVLQKDSTRQFYTATTDENGIFSKGGLVFYDSAQVWYQVNQKNKSQENWRVSLSTNTGSHSLFSQAPVPLIPVLPGTTATSVPSQFLLQNVSDGFTEKGFRLKDVTVTNRKWRNDPMLQMDEKYTSGIFRGSATAFMIDVMDDESATNKLDILNYLVGKVPGLTIQYPAGKTTGGNKVLLYRTTPLTMIFIDEHQMMFEASDALPYAPIQNLNIDEIAYIKFFDRYPLHPDVPALSIYMKKGNEIDTKNVSELPKQKIRGYETIKEFYSPDYSVPDAKQQAADLRTTLYWNPYITTNENQHKASISFYNNDVSSRFYIVFEGMSADGKLLHIEKLVER